MNTKIIKANYRNEEIIVEMKETDEGVVVNINGNASIYNNKIQLTNAKEEGILRLIPDNMISWVKKHMYFSDNNTIEFKNEFTLYLEEDAVKLRDWMYNISEIEEELQNTVGCDISILSELKKELNQLETMFTDRIRLVYSHCAGNGTNYMDIQFKKCDFDSKLIDKIMDKWGSIKDNYVHLLL